MASMGRSGTTRGRVDNMVRLNLSWWSFVSLQAAAKSSAFSATFTRFTLA